MVKHHLFTIPANLDGFRLRLRASLGSLWHLRLNSLYLTALKERQSPRPENRKFRLSGGSGHGGGYWCPPFQISNVQEVSGLLCR